MGLEEAFSDVGPGDADTGARVRREGRNQEAHRATCSARLADAPTTVLAEDESKPRYTNLARGPAAPGTFFGMVGAYALLSFAMIGGWLVYDRRPDA